MATNLQDIFNNILDRQFSSRKLIGIFIKRNINKKGLLLTDDQWEYVEKKLSNLNDISNINLELNSDQIIKSDHEKDQAANIRIIIDLQKGLDEFSNEIQNAISETLKDIIPQITDIIYKDVVKDISIKTQEIKTERQDFETKLDLKWQRAFNLMDLFYAISLEAGDTFNKELKKDQKNILHTALIHLHARSCQVYAEILTLLRTGFADGAHARWRTLHEIAVTAMFLKKFGQDSAERYLLHNDIESHKASLEYQIYCRRLGYRPYTKQEIKRSEQRYNQLLKKFGRAFRKNYGWATEILKGNPTFVEIEKSVGMQHFRPYYKMASHNIHANPKGILFKLGLNSKDKEILLAGPSDSGFVDPGYGAAISLSQVTVALLTTQPNIDRLVQCQLFFKIAKDIEENLLRIQNK